MTSSSPLNGSASATAAEPAAFTGSLSASAAASGSGEAGIAPAEEKRGFVVVDVAGCGCGGGAGFGDSEWERVCRICQLSAAAGEEGSELILLGCGCKGELGVAHRHCAEAWFKVKGNRYCEICGANAKNVTAAVESMLPEEEVHVRREANNRNSFEHNENIVWWRRLPFCNLLMACLIIAFILLWFFRVSMF